MQIIDDLKNKLAKFLEDDYKPVNKEPGVGSTAFVYFFRYKKLSQVRAIKVLKPEILKIKPFKKLFEREINVLSACQHQNVIKIYDKGYINLEEDNSKKKINLPFYIMDYLKDYKDLNSYISENCIKIKIEQLIDIFNDIFEGIKHIHSNNIFHNDIKPANIFINSDNNLVVADFGFAWFIEKDKSGKTIRGGTEKYWDPDIYDYIEKNPEYSYSDENRTLVMVDRKTFSKRGMKWDLYAAGVTIEEILSIVEGKSKFVREYDIKYLRVIAKNLESHKGSDSINSADEAIKIIKKLSRPYGTEPAVPELSIFPQKTLKIPKDISISLTDKITEIIYHPLFLRLEKVKQLGLAGNIYFGANHTRIEHSLGVYNNAIKFIDSLLSSYYDSYFRQIIEVEDIYIFLAAAILHDIGHFPFAHAFEDHYMGEFKHEKLTCSLIEGKFEKEKLPDIFKEFNNINTILKKWGISADDVCSIISKEHKPKNLSEKKCLIFQDMLNSPVDIDKLDYIIRDGIHTGVNYGESIDKNRLIESLIIHPKSRNHLVLLEKGKVIAEAMMFARYCMYSEVYWQYNVRAYESMLSEIIRLVVEKSGVDKNTIIRKMLEFSDEQVLNYFQSDDLGIIEVKELVDCINKKEAYKTLVDFQNIKGNNIGWVWENLIGLRWGDSNPDKKKKYDNFVEDLYKFLSNEIRGLKRHHLVVDVPNTNRIKSEEIEILPHYSNGETMAISESSKIWEDTRENLMNWVQQVRIFIKPEYREKLLSLHGNNRNEMEENIKRTAFEILYKILK